MSHPAPSSSPHLLAPTASDLVKYNNKETILAGFHTDLNFLTIHGRSRYPGLHIWARNTGKRIPVKFPPTGRYLLVQAGKQLEHLSGGLIKAGFHEVVVSQATVEVRVFFTGRLPFRKHGLSFLAFLGRQSRNVKSSTQNVLSSESHRLSSGIFPRTTTWRLYLRCHPGRLPSAQTKSI